MRNIIKNILKEEYDSRYERIKSIVNKYGIEQAIEMVAGGMDTIRQSYVNNPLEFLNQFNDLTLVKKSNMLFYTDKNGSPLFYYYTNRESNIFIDYDRIWMFFEEVIGFSDEEIKGIITKWLEDTYNINGFIPTYYDINYNIK